jgi:ABC-type nitrate/sulfonate/bicarbonate transport system substrate-binding protein
MARGSGAPLSIMSKTNFSYLEFHFLEVIMNKRFLLLAALASSATIGLAQQNATVSLALDWVPNVNHIGVYVAQAQGWYAQRGINLKILPYGSVSPDVLVATNKADLGISSGEGITTAAVNGEPVVSIATVYNTNTSALAVLESAKILRPKDLDGKIYAAFGAPYEKAILERIIKTDGGKGVFKSPTLSVYGLEALLAGKADFMWIFEGVEGVEATSCAPFRSQSLACRITTHRFSARIGLTSPRTPRT